MLFRISPYYVSSWNEDHQLRLKNTRDFYGGIIYTSVKSFPALRALNTFPCVIFVIDLYKNQNKKT